MEELTADDADRSKKQANDVKVRRDRWGTEREKATKKIIMTVFQSSVLVASPQLW